jgi:anti-anti-sigma factor
MLELGIKTSRDLAVVVLRGAIDPKSLSTLEEALAGAKGIRTAVLDLGEVRYINSAGLAYLVNLADALAARGGGLHLANAQPKVKVVFDLMGVSQFFKLYKSVDAALKGLKKSESPARPARWR